MSRESAGAFVLETDGGRRVAVAGGRIADPEAAGGAPVFSAGEGELRPGLINAHDHLGLNHFPRLGEPPYANLYEWAEDVQTRFRDQVARFRGVTEEDALLFGALKNLLGGVARVVHHDRWSPLLDGPFPVRVERVRVLHSLGLEDDLETALEKQKGLRDRPLCMHLAEGVDDRARGEVEAAARRGLLGPDFLGVHLVGAGDGDVALLREAGCGFVWCPSSSLHLYGRTAPEPLFVPGIDLLLGSDSLLSAEGTLLHELRVARATGRTDDRVLAEAVGGVPARRLGLPEPALEPGRPADVLLLRRPLLEAAPADVGLLVVGGRPRYGDASLRPLFDGAGVEVESLEVGGREKLVEAPLGSVARRVTEISPECGRIFR